MNKKVDTGWITRATISIEYSSEKADSVIINPPNCFQTFEKSGYPDILNIPDLHGHFIAYFKYAVISIEYFRQMLEDGEIDVVYEPDYGTKDLIITSEKDLEQVINEDAFPKIMIFVDKHDVLSYYSNHGFSYPNMLD